MADAMLTSEAWHKWKRKLLTEEEASDKKVETTLITVTAPLTAAVTSQELLFWGLDYHIKNT